MGKRAIQTLASGSAGSATTVNIPLSGLQTSVDGEPANVVGFGLRLTKTVASTVRPNPSQVIVRDSAEPLFDSTFLELLGQMRERGEGIQAQLGAASAADTALAFWRPGYGELADDSGHAAGLFQGGGSVQFTTPTDAGQTTNYELFAVLDTSGGLRIAPRAITRTLSSTTRDLQGDFLLARLRDASFSTAGSYSVRTSKREIVTGLSGFAIQNAYESSLGAAGDPVVLTAVAQSTISNPNLIRAILGDFSYGSGEKLPPISRLPDSGGSVTLTSGFVGSPVVTYLYPRSRQEAETLARAACQRHGVSYRAPMPPMGASPELFPYLPLRLVG